MLIVVLILPHLPLYIFFGGTGPKWDLLLNTQLGSFGGWLHRFGVELQFDM